MLDELLANVNPPRRPRTSPRVIKRIVSRYRIKKPDDRQSPTPPRNPTLISPHPALNLTVLVLEHTFGLMKQTLGCACPKLRRADTADLWTWLVIAAHTQLRLARPLARALRRPWERPAEPHRLTPARVRRGVSQRPRLFSASAQIVHTGRRQWRRFTGRWFWTDVIIWAIDQLVSLPHPG